MEGSGGSKFVSVDFVAYTAPGEDWHIRSFNPKPNGLGVFADARPVGHSG
jgi:hypothetical protein